MTIEARTCLLCKHCEIEPGFGGSEVTPADGPMVECKKKLLPRWTSIVDLVGFAQIARRCDGFELMDIPLTEQELAQEQEELEKKRLLNLSNGYDCKSCAGSGFALPGKPEQFGYCRACCGMGKRLAPGDPRSSSELCPGCMGRQVFRGPGGLDGGGQICFTCGDSGVKR